MTRLWSCLVAWERRIRWASVVPALVTISGALLDPAALNVVPASWAHAIVAIGSALQLFTHYVLRAPSDA